ncbi:tectonic-1 isoform X2 [Sinocyclocheilus rhinocerous]|uniref:tectonic-1 isoform X2 n=1 Tax=Sinocyclocheilus rhinocerous TaxID=307959 RepID=UPI0007B7D86E|nr:PREDICTED: tectonic-1 isoform X2 [Sinocyclocheilus rhinocerous]
MAVLCCLIILIYLETALCIEDTNTTGNVNITLRDTNDTSADRNESLDFTDLGVSETPEYFPAPTAWTPESVTAFPDQTESSESSIPDTSPESPRAATAAQPLPLSGVLPAPLTEVPQLCLCNLQDGQCDINCCCDPDCTEELALFTDCTVERVSKDPRLCNQDSAVHTLSSTQEDLSSVQSTVQRDVNPDVFCIQSANYEQGSTFATPEVPTEENFDSLFGRFLGFFGRSRVTSALQSPDVGNSSGYQYGEVIQTVNEAEEQGLFTFPASAGTAHCLDANPAGFLKDQTSRCMRSFDLVQDCETLEALRLETYINFNIRSGKIQEAKVIGVEVAAITLQSLEGTQTPVDAADLESYIPVLLESGDVCNNVVLQVKYTFRYSEAGEILNAIASVLLGAIKSITVPIQQEFQITFLQDISSTPVLQCSGNPGYVVGRPLVAGTRKADGIVQSANPKGSLTILQNSGEQDCLSGSSRRSPVLFGIDMVSGCTLKLSDGVNCSLVSEVILWALKGQSFPDHVASFGNSLPQNPLDWVPIQNQTIALGTQACSIPLSYHLEVKWTKYGTLVNPQAQIVSVMETIITNTSSLALLISADGLLSVTSSVSFVDVSASASPGFKAPPTIDAKLPFDFFFPFV